MDEEIMPVTNDLMFQKIFGKVGNENITKGFLEKLLGIEIESLTLDVNKRMQGEILENKTGRLDIKTKLNDGTTVIIEMQVAQNKYMVERLLYYWSMVYTEGLTRGDDYGELHRVIAILISVENLRQTEGIEEYHTKWRIQEERKRGIILTDDLEMHIVELKKFDKRKEENPEDEWIKFIKAKGKEEMEKISKTDKALEEAIEEYNNLQYSQATYAEVVNRKMELIDKITFLKGAKEDGIDERYEVRKKRKAKRSSNKYA